MIIADVQDGMVVHSDFHCWDPFVYDLPLLFMLILSLKQTQEIVVCMLIGVSAHITPSCSLRTSVHSRIQTLTMCERAESYVNIK